jgi:hypothetical protein
MTTKLVQFTLLIPTNGRLREYNFRQRGDEQYDGNTPHESGERFYFKLHKEGDQWMMEEATLPAWLLDNKDKISEAISHYRNETL